ncbi:cupin 2 conserved barrel domain protein [Deinococcus grandis]|uniref:Cupin 2 conserved barrel domain protein n=1 Tax=Deinococcus grandis TaxID=57498 RepID=A0A100HKN0_9DEIO|nr:cupin domain-containing protein [Deinococcus grandis]BBN94014.1 cupin [Deinococcus grandis]GAQ22479.1 cupin 2 conserved barrel domain protein [Deinococcus grandis]
MSQYKVSQSDTTHGTDGEHHLVKGQQSSMRLWHREEPNADKPESTHEYETLGYVIEGRVDLIVNGETISLQPGDSYHVPAGVPHTFRVTETLTAVEVTTPGTDK